MGKKNEGDESILGRTFAQLDLKIPWLTPVLQTALYSQMPGCQLHDVGLFTSLLRHGPVLGQWGHHKGESSYLVGIIAPKFKFFYDTWSQQKQSKDIASRGLPHFYYSGA